MGEVRLWPICGVCPLWFIAVYLVLICMVVLVPVCANWIAAMGWN